LGSRRGKGKRKKNMRVRGKTSRGGKEIRKKEKVLKEMSHKARNILRESANPRGEGIEVVLLTREKRKEIGGGLPMEEE